MLMQEEVFNRLFWPECHTHYIPLMYLHIIAKNITYINTFWSSVDQTVDAMLTACQQSPAISGILWEAICKYLISTALPQQQKGYTASVVMAWPGWICHVLPPGWRESTLIGMNGTRVAQVERNVIASRKGWSSRNCDNSLHTCHQVAPKHVSTESARHAPLRVPGCSLINMQFRALSLLASFFCFFSIDGRYIDFLKGQIQIFSLY